MIVLSMYLFVLNIVRLIIIQLKNLYMFTSVAFQP